MDYSRSPRRAAGRVYLPLTGSGVDQHRLCRSAGHPHAELAGTSHAAAAAGDLQIHQLRQLVCAEIDAALHETRHARESRDEYADEIAVRKVILTGCFL